MAKKKKDGWFDKFKKAVKKILTEEREKSQGLKDRADAKRLKKKGATDKDLKKMGFKRKKK